MLNKLKPKSEFSSNVLTFIIDSISLNTDLFTEVDELMVFLRKHFMVEYIITGNPQREERYDYSLDAIREIIVVNMIVQCYKATSIK